MSKADIRAAIMKKQEDKIKKSKLTLNDINKPLIMALTALPVYGKEVRDEEILNLLINAGAEDDFMSSWKASAKKRIDAKEIKKDKKGYYRDKDGFIVIVPKM